MKPNQYIQQAFADSIKAKQATLDTLGEQIAAASELMVQCLLSRGKVLVCGNGGSAADAQHFAAELVGRYETDRRGLAAIAMTTDTSALTAIANDMHYDSIFSRQLEALAQERDVLLAISTSGNSKNINQAIDSAHKLNLPIIALTGKTGGKTKSTLSDQDINLCVPADNTARIQEVHILILHCLCGLIERRITNG